MITCEQVREARTLLGWSQVRLAGRSAPPGSAVAKFETGAQRLPSHNLEAIRQALAVAGVEFTNDGPLVVELKPAPAPMA
jgi:transcriptional regulator with XRE-family HTH domain